MDPDSWTSIHLPEKFFIDPKPDYLKESEEALNAWQLPAKFLAKSLLSYPVPKLSPEGVSALPVKLEEREFELAPFFDNLHRNQLEPLYLLATWLKEATESDGVSIYGVYDGPQLAALEGDLPPVLLKVAHDGQPSRAWLPLSQKFAARSNEVKAAVSGEALLDNDVKAHLSAGGGSYYESDPLVQSELCFPLMEAGRLVGLVDLEGRHRGQFQEKDLWLTSLVASRLVPLLKSLPWQANAAISLRRKASSAEEPEPKAASFQS